MGIFNIDLDLDFRDHPRNEPKFKIPRRSAGGRRRSENPTTSISSPRVVVDTELTIRSESTIKRELHSTISGHPVTDQFDGVALEHREQVLLVAQDEAGDETQTVSKLSKPVWPKSTPTIPSTIYKNDFKIKVQEGNNS